MLAGLPGALGEVAVTDGGHGPRFPAPRFTVRAGERVALVNRYGVAEAEAEPGECDALLQETLEAWRGWGAFVLEQSRRLRLLAGPGTTSPVRSALVLKLLTHPDTGAIAPPRPPLSLPEEIGGVRNWDYRFSWIRDAAFTAQALFALGHHAEARDFVQFAQRVTKAGGNDHPLKIQIMYGLHGETDLTEENAAPPGGLPRAPRRCASATGRRSRSSTTSTANCSARLTSL